MLAVDSSDLINRARDELLLRAVEDYFIDPSMTVCKLVEKMGNSGGFMATHLSLASEIITEMWRAKEVKRILSFTGNIVSTGLRGVIAQLIREGFADIVITTCGAVDHDIARGVGSKYYSGRFDVDDVFLHDIHVHRLGNVFIPFESYGVVIEGFVKRLVDEAVRVKREWSSVELLKLAGSLINDRASFLRSAYERNVPVVVPGIVDGAFGFHLFMQSQLTKFKLDVFEDEKILADTVFGAEKLGALIIGGGISKHHTIWWAQFKDGLDYSVYVTTAIEYDGSLSGAQPREAISWNKVKPSAKSIVVYGDATVVLPLIVAKAMCNLYSLGVEDPLLVDK